MLCVYLRNSKHLFYSIWFDPTWDWTHDPSRLRHGFNTGKRARRKNLRHPRERFLVSNEDNILLKVQYFPSLDTPYMKYDVTHVLKSLKNDVKGTEKDI